MKKLFTVDQVFQITGRGLILLPGIALEALGETRVLTGDPIMLIKPDGSRLETVIRGMELHNPSPVLVGKKLKKEDVPDGTEVYLIHGAK
jgi:hypothetical protein